MSVKTITVFRLEEGDADFMPENAHDFIKHLIDMWETVPVEYRDKTQILLTTTRGFDDAYATITMQYRRPETDEERQERENETLHEQECRRERELKELARLRALYPDA